MQGIKSRISSVCRLVTLIAAFALLSGCGNKNIVNFKINSVPKGAYVLYQVIGEGISCQGQWVFLGNTPIQGVRHFNEGELSKAKKITLRIMYHGYQDQIKEWDGDGFWEEVAKRDVILWTPQMIAAEKEH